MALSLRSFSSLMIRPPDRRSSRCTPLDGLSFVHAATR
jgi:hypothetical protein